MKELLDRVKEINSECCVTIAFNTHRTKPDYFKDSLNLKNLITDTESQLLQKYDKRFAISILEKLKQLADRIDHSLNLESLIIFISEDISEYVRLSIQVKERINIEKSFAIRDVVRALGEQLGYYILILNRTEANLIEALDHQLIREDIVPFPIKNNLSNLEDESLVKKRDNLREEFFNRVDKQLSQVWREKQLPILIHTEQRNYHYFLNVTDNKKMIAGHINETETNEPGIKKIIEAAWPVISEIKRNKQSQRLNELFNAVKNGLVLTDPDDIWRAVNEGRGQTLFVNSDYLQPARITADHLEMFYDTNITAYKLDDNTVEDIIDEMIEFNLRNSGDVVFVTGDELKYFNGLALVTRY